MYIKLNIFKTRMGLWVFFCSSPDFLYTNMFMSFSEAKYSKEMLHKIFAIRQKRNWACLETCIVT